MVYFGQLVVGPPGSGKTTYCDGIQQMCKALERPCIVINLDPANDQLSYTCEININDIITVEDVMKEHLLGPNGALLFCMEYLLTNIDWFISKLRQFQDYYLIIDCPGQVELYTHNTVVVSFIQKLYKQLDVRMTAVYLMDSSLCSDPSKYMSGLLTSLSCQILLELPHINVLTKIDILKRFKEDLAFRFEYYAEVQDLRYLLSVLESSFITPSHPFDTRFKRLESEICSIVEDFNLSAFLPLNIQEKESVMRVLQQVDTANGYSLSGAFKDPTGLFKIAIGPSLGLAESTFGTVQEQYIDVDEDCEDLQSHVANK